MAVHNNAFGGWWLAKRELQANKIKEDDLYLDFSRESGVLFAQPQKVWGY